ncbi:PAS domain-containing protein [Aerophototrophica crusticola]|uniref:histidine kinase n=1 Tax=Aerophototrophica crusticola TaxID=1709002 RepID=A0A858R7F2_9PROT|nr:PAS domain-containing protein [Rhodospirillaceae bacterium B3]
MADTRRSQPDEGRPVEPGPDKGTAGNNDTGQGQHWRKGVISRPGLDERGSIFFAAVEMTRMPMIVTDPNLPDNPIVFANEAFLDLTGYEMEEIQGRNCRFLQGARTDRETVNEIREALEARRAVSVELLNYRRDGTPFWNALFIGPIFDESGTLRYFFASQLDVTRRRVSEQAYRQAQKMEAIGQLTAGLAHDFNNLLQVVSGNLELALELDGLPPEAGRAVENADRAARQGAKLTQQLLAFARKTRLDPRPTNLNSLVVEFSDMLDRTLGDQIELRLDLKPRLPECTVDPIHVEMALLNVLINARDALPGGGKVTISTGNLKLNGDAAAHQLTPGDYVWLAVRDEGTGMSPDVLERAIEPFFSTKGPGKGTGLGLSMVHGFLQQSGGRLELQSEAGKGTTVRMVFPVQAVRSTWPMTVPDHPREEQGGEETILVVDDSEDVRGITAHQLQGLGYRVLTAPSGEEALKLLEAGDRVDLLFTDLVMPGGMNGLVLMEKARAVRPDLGVLLATGYTEELVAEGPRTPAMDVLGKPYRRSELADRVRAALNRAHAPPQPGARRGKPVHEA